jgi:signal transduction histidine kinase
LSYGELPGILRTIVYYEYTNNLNGSLLFIPFCYATILFWWRGAFITLAVSEVIMLPYVSYMSYNPQSFALNILYSLLPFLIIGLITLEFKLREKDKKSAIEREVERQSYMAQIFKTQENERRRISQELHDDALQMLYVIADRSRSLEAANKSERNIDHIKEETEWIRKSILQVAEDIRRISLDLRPSVLDDLSLVAALRWFIDLLNQHGDPHIQLDVIGTERKIRPEADVMIFRIIQEALNNARKHAHATLVHVTLEFIQDTCKITIRDNGEGFNLPPRITNLATKGKLGLIGMQQRAQFLGGTFHITSEPGAGTVINIEAKI